MSHNSHNNPVITLVENNNFVPIEKGYDKGTSGAFGGVLGEYIIMGGGCNFPDKPLTDGGKKKYYSAIYALRDGESTLVAQMPAARGYGASVISSDGSTLYFVGGTDDAVLYPAVFEVRIEDDEVRMERTEYPLPFGWSEGGAALLDHKLYIVGGWCEKGKPLTEVVSLDLLTGKVENVATLPNGQGRIQPGVFMADGRLYVFGGNNPSNGAKPASVHEDGYVLDLDTKEWKEVSMPHFLDTGELLPFVGTAVTKAPNDGSVYAVGGVDREVFNAALLREYKQSQASNDELEKYQALRLEYLTHDPSWYHFSKILWLFEPTSGTWREVASDPALATAGGVLAADSNGSLFLIGGEEKPGIRTPNIYRIELPEG